MPFAGEPDAGVITSVGPVLAASAPSIGSAIVGAVVHSEPAGNCRLPEPSVRVLSQVGLYIAVLVATIVFTRVRPSPKMPPATCPFAVEWLFAIVQFFTVPVGV